MDLKEETDKQRLGKLIIKCLLFSLTFRLLAAWFSIGFYHPDEFFQIFEFAAYKMGISPFITMPWELASEVRPAIQPAIVVFIHKYMGAAADPIFIPLLLRILSSLLGLGSIIIMLLVGLRMPLDYNSKRLLVLLYSFFWFFPIVQSHFSGEGISGSLFFIGLGALWLSFKNGKNLLLIISGFLFGLSFTVRFQTAFMILGIMVWAVFVARFSLKKLLLLGVPALIAIAIGIIIDHWFYSEWVFVPWNYYKANLIEGKAALYGTFPWWSYFKWAFIDLIPPFSLLILSGLLYALYKFPKNIVSLAFIPFILAHIIIGHKEARFLNPLINGIPILLSLAYYDLKQRFSFNNKIVEIILVLFCVINAFVMIFTCISPEDDRFKVHKYIYYHYNNIPFTLISYNGSPYDFGFLRDYYDKPRQIIQYQEMKDKQIDSLIPISKHPVVLVFEYTKSTINFIQNHPEAKLVYQGLPEWLHIFNFNHWMDRTKIWYIYEINDPK